MAGGEQREPGPLPPVHLTSDDGVQSYTEPHPRFSPDGSNRAAFIPGRSVVHVTAVEGEWVQVMVDDAVVGWVSGSRLVPPIGMPRPVLPMSATPPPASPYVVSASQPVSNGFAVAALTLGVIGAVFAFTNPFGSLIGIVCAFQALVFGFSGLRNVNRYGAGLAGLAISGIVLGSVGLAVGGYEAWNFYRLRHAVEHAINAQASIPVVNATSTANRVHFNHCYQGGASGTLVNTANKRETFRVTVAFHDGRRVRRYATVLTDPVEPGEQTSWFVQPSVDVFTPSACTIIPRP
jgi:hypothetical protein